MSSVIDLRVELAAAPGGVGGAELLAWNPDPTAAAAWMFYAAAALSACVDSVLGASSFVAAHQLRGVQVADQRTKAAAATAAGTPADSVPAMAGAPWQYL